MRIYSIAQGLHSVLCGDLNRQGIYTDGVCVYVQVIHFSVQQKLTTQHCKATILQ